MIIVAKYRFELATIDPETNKVEIPATARIVGFAPWDNRRIAYLMEIEE